MDTAGILALLTILAAGIYAIYGVILAYHWVRFSSSWTITVLSIGSYTISGIYLLSLMAVATLSI